MGVFASDRARKDGQGTLVQLGAAVASFVAFSVLGGLVLAGLALPAVSVASQAAEGTSELFEELPQSLADVSLPQASYIYASDGTTLLATFYNQNRIVVPLEEISPWLQKAIVSIEDRRFWLHKGVDGEGLMRAIVVNTIQGDSQGASTITQQVVKNTLLQRAVAETDAEKRDEAIKAATEPTTQRKIREWRLALALEERLTKELGDQCDSDPKVDCAKEQILETYLNIAQFGVRAYGVEAAAQMYFSKSAAEVTALEAATIVGITQNPTKWDPTRNPENSQVRRNLVLAAMRDQGMITEAEFTMWSSTPIESTLNVSYPRASCSASADAPFFCDYVTKVIAKDPIFNQEGMELKGYQLLERGGLRIVTTLDINKQRIANEELRKEMPIDDPSGFAMSMVSLETKTGRIEVMAQTREYDPASQAPNSTAINYNVNYEYGGSRGFSPGSTFKPVILAAWLDSGRSLNQVVSGAIREWQPSSWNISCANGSYTGAPWRPRNSGGTGASQMNVLRATVLSINTSYVAMANQLDLCDVRDIAYDMGFERADAQEFDVVPSLVLGSQNASPLSMASMYQTIANSGVRCEPIAIDSVTDLDGNTYEVPPMDCAAAINNEVADGVSYALETALKQGSGRVKQLAGRPAAGKTGTSQNNKHTWFAGFTPQLTTVTWLGHPNRDTPQQNIVLNGKRWKLVYGKDIALTVWKAYMDRALEGQEALPLANPSSRVLNGIQVPIPTDVLGMEEKAAQNALNDAGFLYENGGVIFSSEYPVGTVAKVTPSAGSSATVGTTVVYYLAIAEYPHWWFNWPSNWDRATPPSDYWGTQWPPAEWTANPPNGWAITPPTPDPVVTPTPDPSSP